MRNFDPTYSDHVDYVKPATGPLWRSGTENLLGIRRAFGQIKWPRKTTATRELQYLIINHYKFFSPSALLFSHLYYLRLKRYTAT